MNQLICASLFHTHYWSEVGMLKVSTHPIPTFDVIPFKAYNNVRNTEADIVFVRKIKSGSRSAPSERSTPRYGCSSNQIRTRLRSKKKYSRGDAIYIYIHQRNHEQNSRPSTAEQEDPHVLPDVTPSHPHDISPSCGKRKKRGLRAH